MTPITGLRPDIVPHQQWALSSWFYASSLWYYHRLGPGRSLIADPGFYDQIDPDLRPLCRLLHTQGLLTTPSCQGHFYPKEHFEPTWDQLQRERTLIRTAGLLVRDCQTQAEHLWHEPDYGLPWSCFDDFHAQVIRQQGTGYLGILAPRNRADLYRNLQAACQRTPTVAFFSDGPLTRVLGCHVFGILVRCRDQAEQSRQWQQMTSLLESLFCPLPSLDAHPYTFLESPHAWR